jgi:putative heme iron utilization protein
MSEISAEHHQALLHLLSAQRVATLAVIERDGTPGTAMVAFAWHEQCHSVLVHLSGLSAHKRALLAHPSCSLLVHEQDHGRSQPLQLKRAALRGAAQVLERSHADYANAEEIYLTKLPASRMMFTLGDFDLLKIEISEIRFVAGFGEAFTVRF